MSRSRTPKTTTKTTATKPPAPPQPDATTTTEPTDAIETPTPETTPEPEAPTPETATTAEAEPVEPELNLETEPASEPIVEENHEIALRMASIVGATVEPGLDYFRIPGLDDSYVSTNTQKTYLEIYIPHDKAAAVLQLLAP